jgi:hypothetical protein
MSVVIQEVGNGRSFAIEADNVMCPESVFITGRKGDVFEYDRTEFLTGVIIAFSGFPGVGFLSELLQSAA